jgi:Putative beta-barrel porin-2, OmpL-like. bbp2
MPRPMLRKFNKVLTALAVASVAPATLFAADAPEAPKYTGPSLSDIITGSGLTINGYADVAYSYLNSSGLFTSGVPSRVFDTEPSSFNLHQAALIVGYQPKEGFGGLVNLTAGRDARVIKSYDTTTNDFDVTQAFMQYAHGPLTLMAGKYVTLAGAEVINSTADFTYSRSILFGYAIPFTHTGVRATYAVSDTVNVLVGLNNGWDQLKDANKQKTVELGVAYAPSKAFTLAAQGYSGTEQVAGFTDTVGGRRDLIDVVATYVATDKFTFILNYDWGSQENVTAAAGGTFKAKWDGIAGYVNYQIADQWRLSVRGEYFDDKNGYRTGVVQKWKEGTVDLVYLPVKAVEIRAEVRGDLSDQHAFVDNVARFLAAGDSTKKNQTSFGLEGIFKF